MSLLGQIHTPQRTVVTLLFLLIYAVFFNKNSLKSGLCNNRDRSAEEDASRGLGSQFAGIWERG